MPPFRDFPIRWKLTLIITLISAVVVVLMGAGIIGYEVITFRTDIVQRVSTLAEIVAANSAAPLAFQDPKAANETIATLQLRPDIAFAGLYTADGKRFVHFSRGRRTGPRTLEPSAFTKPQFQQGDLFLVQPVRLGNDPVGALLLRFDLHEQQARLKTYVGIVGLTMGLLLIIALVLAARLQRIVSGPILDLTRVAAAVTAQKDYTLRVQKRTNDEIGMLADDFNQMLRQIEQQDTTLRASEAKFRGFVESAPDAIVIVGQHGRILLVNAQTERLFGYSRAELYDRPMELLMPDQHRQRHAGHREKFFVDPHVRPMGTGLELFGQRKDGTQFPVEVSLSPLSTPEGGLVCGAIRDITRRKQVEEALRASEQRFRQLAEAIHEVFWMTDPAKTQMVYISPAYEQIWGRTCASLYASPMDWVEAIHPEDRDRVLQAALTRQAAGEYDEEYRIVRPGGAIRWIRDRAFLVRDASGQIVRIAGVAEDITQRKSLEREVLEISTAEQRRIGYDLHDGLGQYLTGIALKMKLLEENLRSDGASHADGAKEIVALVNNAIGQARSLARGLDPTHVEADGLMAALDQLATDSEGIFGVACNLTGPESAPPLDKFASLQIYQIAREAVNNALKHARPRQIEIGITVDAGIFALSVRDDGAGFSPTTQRHDGLGLRIMHYRARSIGGTFQINRLLPAGTEVRCVVPTLRSQLAGPDQPNVA